MTGVYLDETPLTTQAVPVVLPSESVLVPGRNTCGGPDLNPPRAIGEERPPRFRFRKAFGPCQAGERLRGSSGTNVGCRAWMPPPAVAPSSKQACPLHLAPPLSPPSPQPPPSSGGTRKRSHRPTKPQSLLSHGCPLSPWRGSGGRNCGRLGVLGNLGKSGHGQG